MCRDEVSHAKHFYAQYRKLSAEGSDSFSGVLVLEIFIISCAVVARIVVAVAMMIIYIIVASTTTATTALELQTPELNHTFSSSSYISLTLSLSHTHTIPRDSTWNNNNIIIITTILPHLFPHTDVRGKEQPYGG